jgi:branched-chain amino acid transport system ATP-binding protein
MVPSSRPQPALNCQFVAKGFAGAAILDRVSLDLYPGTITVLSGRNGSGKTTLINCLSGFDADYDGDVLLRGDSLRGKDFSARARLGVVRTFQHPNLFADFTVREQLLLAPRTGERALPSYFLYRWEAREMPLEAQRAVALLDRGGLELSYGEMKFVNTLRAFATGASVLLLDEPLASLHGAKAQLVLEAIVAAKNRGCSLLVIEHVLQELEAVADAVLELVDGRIAHRSL